MRQCRKDIPEPLGYKFRRIDKRIQKYFSTRMVNDGKELTRMQSATIRYLIENEGRDVFQKDLERDFSIKGATATNILKLMEKDGVIRRVPLERDARLKKLVLTEKGYRLDAIAHDNIENLEIGIRKGLSEEEITIFSNILDKIAQNIEDLIKENPKEN